MAFPTIPTTAAGRVLVANQLDTTAARTFPDLSGLTKNSGDLLIAIVVAYQSSTTNAQFGSWGGGFTEIHDSGTSTTLAMGVAYKWSDGTETGTFTVTQAGTITGDASMILLSIPGAHRSTPPEAGSRADGTGAAADPAAFNPSGWDAEDTLWISVVGSGMTSGSATWTATGTTAPSNYTSRVDTNATDTSTIGDCEAAVAFRQLAAESEDVGAAGVDTSNARNSALVIAVRPAPPSVTQTAASAWNVIGTISASTASAWNVKSIVGRSTPSHTVGVTGASPPYPSDHEPGDALFMVAGWKPVTCAPPAISGWTLLQDLVAGSGADGDNTGPIRTAVWRKDVVTGDETGSVSVTPVGVANVVIGGMLAYGSATGGWEHVQYDYATDEVSDTTLLLETQGTLDLSYGDQVVWLHNTNINDSLAISAPTATGGVEVSVGSANGTTVTGNNAGICRATVFVNAGSATGVVITTTRGSTTPGFVAATAYRLRSGTTQHVAQTAAAAWHVKAPLTEPISQSSRWRVFVEGQDTTDVLWASGTPTTTGSTWVNTASTTGAADGSMGGWTSSVADATGSITLAGYGAQAAIGDEPDTVDAVEVVLTSRVASALTSLAGVTIQLADNGTPFGSSQQVTLSPSNLADEVFTFTGVTWAQLANLGVLVTVTHANNTDAALFQIDAASVFVVYTPGTTTTPVTQTADSAWAITGSATQTAAAAWHVKAALSAPATSGSAWRVLEALTPATRDAAWRVLEAVTDTAPSAWHVRATIAAATRAAAWDVLATLAASTRDAAWDVLATLSPATRDSAWRALAQVEQTRAAAWHVEQGVVPVTQTADTAWDVLATLTPRTTDAAWRVLATTTPATRDAAWAVDAQTTQSRDSAWAVDAQVTQSADTAWAVDAQVTDTAPAAWRVLAQVPQTRDSAWRVLATLSPATRDAAWDVLTTLDPATRDAAWDVLTTLTPAQRAAAWDVLTTLTPSSSAAAWDVLEAVTPQTRDSTWRVLAGLTPQTRDSAWAVDEQVTATTDSAWDVEGPIGQVTQTQSTAWHVGGPVTATTDSGWAIAGPVTATTSSAWDVLATTSPATSPAAWAIDAPVAQTHSSAWDVLSARTQSVNAAWDVTATTSPATSAAAWDVLAALTNGAAAAWHVKAPVDGTTNSAWAVKAQVTQSRASTWQVAGPVTASADAAWDVRSATTQTTDTAYRVLAAVPQTRSSAWAVDATITQTKTSGWAIAGPVGATTQAGWHVRAQTTATAAAAWDVLTTTSPATRGSAWRVLAALTDTAPTAWKVQARLDATAPAAWDVLATTSNTTDTAWDVLATLTPATWPTAWRINEALTAATTSAWNVAAVIAQPLRILAFTGPWAGKAETNGPTSTAAATMAAGTLALSGPSDV